MTVDLRIDRLRSTYRLSAGAGDPEAVRERLDACAETSLPRAIERLLPGVLASLGLGPAHEIAVASLRVRVRVIGEDVTDARVAEGWAEALLAALRAVIEPLARAGAGATTRAALFPDRFAAEVELLHELLSGLPEPWWAAPILGRKAGSDAAPPPASILARWLAEHPERFPSALSDLLARSPLGLDRVLAEGEAAALRDALVRGRELRRLELLDGGRGAPGAAAHEGSRAPRSADEDQAAAAQPEGSRDPRASAEERIWASLLAPHELVTLRRTRGDRARLLLATCLVLARRPALGAADLARIVGEPAPGAPPHDLADPEPRGAREAPARPSREEAAERDRDPSRSPPAPSRDRRAPAEDVAGDSTTRAAGLLFLVRRVARSDWLDGGDMETLEARLDALARTALLRALGGLPEAERRAALAREEPIVAVFSGALAPSDVAAPRAPPDGSLAEDAARLLDEIAAELPGDLAPFTEGMRSVYGPATDPFPLGHPHRALAHLLLRPGRLVLSAHRADLHLPMRAVDLALRVGGWDIDPGFVPHLGRVLRFHYER